MMSNSAQSHTNSHSDEQMNSSKTTQETRRSPVSDESNHTDEVLELCDLQKHYGTETVVDHLSLSVNSGEILTLLGPSGCGNYPDELSGGQQQRVALARSLAPEPDILLLDEPFSNLDVDLRVAMREEVRRILKEAGVTAISVTHDQEEALSISDRVAVMSDGHIEQVGKPEAVFQHPESRFVASFLGYASFIPGYVSGDVVQTEVGTVPREQIHGLISGTTADEYADTQINEYGCGEVVARRYLGPTFLYEVELETGESVQCMHNHDEDIPESGVVDIEINADHELAWFPREQRPDETDERYPRGI